MVSLAEDLKLALDRVSFAKSLGLEPDPWQEDLLCSTSDRVLLNCCRQSGKSTMTAIVALHRALYHPGSLILCLSEWSHAVHLLGIDRANLLSCSQTRCWRYYLPRA